MQGRELVLTNTVPASGRVFLGRGFLRHFICHDKNFFPVETKRRGPVSTIETGHFQVFESLSGFFQIGCGAFSALGRDVVGHFLTFVQASQTSAFDGAHVNENIRSARVRLDEAEVDKFQTRLNVTLLTH